MITITTARLLYAQRWEYFTDSLNGRMDGEINRVGSDDKVDYYD